MKIFINMLNKIFKKLKKLGSLIEACRDW